MKKTVSILSLLIASLLASSTFAGEKILLASAETRTFANYELESFNSTGLPQ